MPGRKQAGDAWNEQSRQLADLLRERRKSAGLTQEAVAREARVALSTLRKIETNDIREPGIFTVVALLHALGLTFSQLTSVVEAGRDTSGNSSS